MSNLFVLQFDDVNTSMQVIDTMKRLQQQQLIKLDDAALVIKQPNGKLQVKQLHDLVGAGALGGAFWGMLIGLLVFAPLLGAAIGAGAGAMAGKLSDYGIDDNFIKKIGTSLQPGNASLFLMTSHGVADKVLPELKKHKFQLIETSLSSQDEAKLRDALGTK